MIVGMGLDLVDTGRFEAAVRRRPALLKRVFTPGERSACERKADAICSYAARFAAKEAAMKALGTGWGQGVGWQSVEVVGGAWRGAPGLVLHGRALEHLHAMGGVRALVSLTHEKTMAAAVVILES